MESINLREAKARLSELIERVQQGERFIIAKAGKPLVRVTAIDASEPGQQKRIGFLAGQSVVPDHFNRLGEDEIAEMFGSSI